MAAAIARHAIARANLDCVSSFIALRKEVSEASTPKNQSTKPLASGAATLWHGYATLEGLGTTRTRNQSSARSPATGNSHELQRRFPSASQRFFSNEQVD
jgi:hypothetical protein